MSNFQTALDDFLKDFEGGEVAFAELIGTTQASVNRYRNGKRYPDANMARVIDEKTESRVSFAAWQSEFLARSGISASEAA